MGILGKPGALPAELITDILEYLPIGELWTATRVSRQFYAASWRAGLFIHRNIRWELDSYAPALAIFKEVLELARRNDLRVSLTLRCLFLGEHDPNVRANNQEAAQTAADELFPAISAALPFLIHLSLQVPDYFRPQLDRALRFPAPRLLTLELLRTVSDPCPVPLPRDLLSGSAPQLHTVKLDMVTLPNEIVPAFRSVSHFATTHMTVFPHIKFGLQFPSLVGLHLKFIEWGYGDTVLPDRCDIAALGLRDLIIEDIADYGTTPLLDAVGRCSDLSAIPLVAVTGRRIRWDERLSQKDTAALSMRIKFRRDDLQTLHVTVMPTHQRWRRVYSVAPWETDMPLAIRGFSSLSARLVHLRIDGMLVGNFLALGIPLPVLRSLHIDMQSRFCGHISLLPKDYSRAIPYVFQKLLASAVHDASCVRTPCPALEAITLFALDAPIIDAEWRRVVCLAHAVRQMQRPKAERAALALVGLEFEKPVDCALLDQAVSTMCDHAFAGLGSREDYDAGLCEPVPFSRLR